MQIQPTIWYPRVASLVLSSVAALSVAYWGLHWQLPASAVMAAVAVGASEQPVDTQVVGKALGAADLAQAAVPGVDSMSESSRFVLLGVVGNAGTGSALIAVDGGAAKPVRIGAEVADGWRLQSVTGRNALLVNNASELELSLPALPSAFTGAGAPAGTPIPAGLARPALPEGEAGPVNGAAIQSAADFEDDSLRGGASAHRRALAPAKEAGLPMDDDRVSAPSPDPEFSGK